MPLKNGVWHLVSTRSVNCPITLAELPPGDAEYVCPLGCLSRPALSPGIRRERARCYPNNAEQHRVSW